MKGNKAKVEGNEKRCVEGGKKMRAGQVEMGGNKEGNRERVIKGEKLRRGEE